ncbi:hypothetical protein JCM13664_04270 [Methylothermus subterraneus]
MNEALPTSPERRRYFRIEDEIVLVYRTIPPEEVPDPERFPSQFVDRFALTSTLEYLSRESQVPLRLIQRDYPEVAKYLEVLERKLNVLAQALMISTNPLTDQPTHKVNLSASGIAFDAEQFLAAGQVLELKMIVPPALVGILTFGRVVYCCEQESGRYRIGVDFLALRDQDREFLIRHVVKRQLARLREQRQAPSDRT